MQRQNLDSFSTTPIDAGYGIKAGRTYRINRAVAKQLRGTVASEAALAERLGDDEGRARSFFRWGKDKNPTLTADGATIMAIAQVFKINPMALVDARDPSYEEPVYPPRSLVDPELVTLRAAEDAPRAPAGSAPFGLTELNLRDFDAEYRAEVAHGVTPTYAEFQTRIEAAFPQLAKDLKRAKEQQLRYIRPPAEMLAGRSVVLPPRLTAATLLFEFGRSVNNIDLEIGLSCRMPALPLAERLMAKADADMAVLPLAFADFFRKRCGRPPYVPIQTLGACTQSFLSKRVDALVKGGEVLCFGHDTLQLHFDELVRAGCLEPTKYELVEIDILETIPLDAAIEALLDGAHLLTYFPLSAFLERAAAASKFTHGGSPLAAMPSLLFARRELAESVDFCSSVRSFVRGAKRAMRNKPLIRRTVLDGLLSSRDYIDATTQATRADGREAA